MSEVNVEKAKQAAIVYNAIMSCKDKGEPVNLTGGDADSLLTILEEYMRERLAMPAQTFDSVLKLAREHIRTGEPLPEDTGELWKASINILMSQRG